MKPKLLVFIVAYNAETTIRDVLSRIPHELNNEYLLEILIIDDSSDDFTLVNAKKAALESSLACSIKLFYNPVNLGYGGNQKIGYHYAIENKFDFVALLHGDGQYAPELLGYLIKPLKDGVADAVFGSRMMNRGDALKGNMPLYKYVGNKILTFVENFILNSNLSEFHSGYRIYSVAALKTIPFDLNTDDFHFDSEIIIQLIFAEFRIKELPIPTYYGEEICRVNGINYAINVVKAALVAKLQKFGIGYDPKFDRSNSLQSQYTLKLDYKSPHSQVFLDITPASSVLDLGCAGGYVGNSLKEKLGCKVTGVDSFSVGPNIHIDQFIKHDLNQGMPAIHAHSYDFILLLDVIEHLASPEKFIHHLRKSIELNPELRIIASTGNIAFIIPRIMLLIGQFNYGKRGILDITHTRLFTFSSFRNLFIKNGFEVVFELGIPAPLPLALGNNKLSKFLVYFNSFLIQICKGVFSYQIYLIVKAKPSLSYLLINSIRESEKKLKCF